MEQVIDIVRAMLGSSQLPLVPDLRVDDARTCEERYESLTSTTNRGFAGIGVTSRKCDGQ